MNRIKTRFSALKDKKKKALIPFITAGDPHPDITVDLMHELVNAGADIIELGMPFSDPMADGPIIQRASERALAQGTNINHVFDMVKEFRTKDEATPVILMGYMNPVEVMGYQQFANKANQVGVDGLLLVDLPPEESTKLIPVLKSAQLDQIFLLSPTTGDKRLDRICKIASGFLYYVSLKGVTGSNQLDIDLVAKRLDHIRKKTSLPLAVGFGIKDIRMVQLVGKIADAVVIGSALVELIAKHTEDRIILKRELSAFAGSLRQGLDKIQKA